MNPREAFERQAEIARGMSRQRMSQVVKDSLAQQFNLGNPEQEESIFQLGSDKDKTTPSIQIKIGGMLNDAMTKPQQKRGRPSIDIRIS